MLSSMSTASMAISAQPAEQLPLAQVVLAYREEYLVERSLGRLKGQPLSLSPRYVERDDHATGLIRLLAIELRVLTLLEFVVRRKLTQEGERLAGLYAGNPKRATAHPTTERLLEAFRGITLTIIVEPLRRSSSGFWPCWSSRQPSIRHSMVIHRNHPRNKRTLTLSIDTDARMKLKAAPGSYTLPPSALSPTLSYPI
jgi:hypothetical protein